MRSDLTDEEWATIEPLLPPLPRRADSRGRPWNEPRRVLNGILWVLVNGTSWPALPKEYPPFQTCHRWFQRWVTDETLEKIVKTLAWEAGVDLSECFIDGTFIPAKKGRERQPRPQRQRYDFDGYRRRTGVARRCLDRGGGNPRESIGRADPLRGSLPVRSAKASDRRQSL